MCQIQMLESPNASISLMRCISKLSEIPSEYKNVTKMAFEANEIYTFQELKLSDLSHFGMGLSPRKRLT